MWDLTEANVYQQDKIGTRKIYLTIKPVDTFNIEEIKQIHQKTNLSQVMFAGLPYIPPKIVEAWENGRNKPEGASRRFLEIANDDPGFSKAISDGKQMTKAKKALKIDLFLYVLLLFTIKASKKSVDIIYKLPKFELSRKYLIWQI